VPEPRAILKWSARALLAAAALAGLALLCLPNVARGLGRPSTAEVTAQMLARQDTPEEPQGPLLTAAGLTVNEQDLARNRDRWKEMSEAERAAMLDRLGRLQGLEQSERILLVSRYHDLRKLSEKERQELRRQAMALTRFEASLGRQDLAALAGLAGQERAKYLLDLWRVRQGLP
jgi:hypothetical protein